MATFPELFRSNSTNTLREISRVQREIDRLFDGFTAGPWDRPWRTGEGATTSASWAPPCEVHETEAAYELRAEMPGVKKEDIQVDIEEDRVSFRAEKKSAWRSETSTDAPKGARTHFSEMTYGVFSRSFTLPQAIDLEKSGAAFDHGVLTITLTKAAPPAAKARTLAVK